ncbi:MAG: hypothetical protein ABFS56_31905 [Pseudomonadota bacterium]
MERTKVRANIPHIPPLGRLRNQDGQLGLGQTDMGQNQAACLQHPKADIQSNSRRQIRAS